MSDMSLTNTATMRQLSTRSEIVCAAQKLFAEQGYATTTLKDIMSHLTIQKQGVYHYFDGKLELAKVCFQDHIDYCRRSFFNLVLCSEYQALMMIERLAAYIVRDVCCRLPLSFGTMYKRHESLKGLYTEYCDEWQTCFKTMMCHAPSTAGLHRILLAELLGVIELMHTGSRPEYVTTFKQRLQCLLLQYGNGNYDKAETEMMDVE